MVLRCIPMDARLSEQETVLKTQRQAPLFNFELNQQTTYFNLVLLSKPEIIRLRYAETRCPQGHSVRIIKLFSLDEKVCPQHNCELEKTFTYSQIELFSFYAEAADDKVNIFIPKEQLKLKLDISNRINVKGYDVSVQTKTKGIFQRGIFVETSPNIEIYEEKFDNQKSMLTKDDAIELFGADLPSLNLSKHDLFQYKHGLLLSTVTEGINILVIGNPGTIKTEFALTLKEITRGAYVEVPNATDTGLIGMAVKNYDGLGYHFEGGAIFDAKNNLLCVDEADKTEHYSFFRHLNGIMANQTIDFRKGNVKFHDSDFKISLCAFGNPLNGRFNSIPKMEIDQTFKRNKEFLSRIHLTFALNCSEPDPSTIREYDKDSLKIYIRQARAIKLTEKDIPAEVKEQMRKLYKLNIGDERFYKKLQDLVIAEAKFALHKQISMEDLNEVEKILEVQKRLLYTKA